MALIILVLVDYPKRIIFQLSEYLQTDIIPGSTLLFIDEIQIVPSAVITLR